jgi:SAM-dependent methyltransferase
MNTDSTTQSWSHWDSFWRTHDKAMLAGAAPGVGDLAPAAFWRQFFTPLLSDRQPLRMIDIACGNGAVTTVAIEAAGQRGAVLDIHCADRSPAAVLELCSRHPQVAAVACDAGQLPYLDGSFDLVVSQFGIEYAGQPAFSEAARLVRAGGRLAAIVHSVGSALHKECVENLAAVRAVKESGLLESAQDAFAASLAGQASIVQSRLPDRRLAAAVETTKQILRDKRAGVLAAFLANLLRDLGYVHGRIENYSREKLFAWLDAIEGELEAYEGRMSSMTESALDAAAIERVASRLTSEGLTVDPPQTLALHDSGMPAGCVLSARREAETLR